MEFVFSAQAEPDGSCVMTNDVCFALHLRMIEILGGWWLFCRIFRLIPRGIRDYFYDAVARNRYKWFGKTECCKLIPDDFAKTML
jgi:predicted DCC family thiol-disulfide oxidoreductase YuxK